MGLEGIGSKRCSTFVLVGPAESVHGVGREDGQRTMTRWIPPARLVGGRVKMVVNQNLTSVSVLISCVVESETE